jgi:hypothetical protein
MGGEDAAHGGERSWRVPVAQVVLKAGAAAPFLLLAGIATAGLAALALRDVLAPVRVAADAEGVTVVTGFAGRRRLPWPAVTALRVDERQRLLLHTRLLEIETEGDLHLFSAFDLGEDVRDVAAELERLRARADH